MKILHVVENLDRGAVENWLVNIFLESKKIRPDWEWTFYCILGRAGRLDSRVENAGGNIIYSPVTISDKVAFLKNLRRQLKKGQYDVLHVHHDYLSGFYLLASVGIKFRKRFLHVHNTDKALPVGSKALQKLLLFPFRKIGTLFSDTIVGISEHTLSEFTHLQPKQRDGRLALLYYGIDMDRFSPPPQRQQVREQLAIPDTGKILLYTGRMNDLKNPEFVIEVLRHLLQIRNDVYAVFVGTGDKQSDVDLLAKSYGISDHVKLIGWHDNVPLLMKSSDIFIFPRKEFPKEGLGLVVVEAQAAGLPMFITRGIVNDAIEIPELTHFDDLTDAGRWAKHIDEVLKQQSPISQEEALNKMKTSKFELGNAAKNLIDLYER